jgi:hypothetical protein
LRLFSRCSFCQRSMLPASAPLELEENFGLDDRVPIKC